MSRNRVLVTGASSGIGLATARRLLNAGHRVVATGRRLDEASAAAVGLQTTRAGQLEISRLDLADLEALPARLDALARRYDDLDSLVLNAGKGLLGNLEQCSYRQIRELIDLDLTAQIFCARAFLPGLKRRGRGDVVLMGSEAAIRGGRGGSVYSAAKFALRGFAEALRQECSKAGVRVTLINPGMVRTPFFDELPIRPGPEPSHALRPEDVAETVALVLALPPEAVVDRIDLSPLKSVVERKR